jgi:hypothetical protein
MGTVRGWPPLYCSRAGTIERSGRLYCKQHDPGDPGEKRRKRLARHAEEEARREMEHAKIDRRQLEQAACRGLSNDDLRRIIDSGATID